jgi:predicted ATPase
MAKLATIVLTGGPYAGKTSLISFLESQGYQTTPEAAMIVIDRLNSKLGRVDQLRWRQSHPAEFQSMVADVQLELEAGARHRSRDMVFLDRGLHDGIAYCNFFGVPLPDVLNSTELYSRYSFVFVLETLAPFSPREHTGRSSTEETSRAIGAAVFDAYRAFGHTPRWIEVMPLERRADAILQAVKAGLA